MIQPVRTRNNQTIGKAIRVALQAPTPKNHKNALPLAVLGCGSTGNANATAKQIANIASGRAGLRVGMREFQLYDVHVYLSLVRSATTGSSIRSARVAPEPRVLRPPSGS